MFQIMQGRISVMVFVLLGAMSTLQASESTSKAAAGASEREAELTRRLAVEEERVHTMARELRTIQEQMVHLSSQAEARFAELENERDEQVASLHEASRTLQLLRDNFAQREALLQETQAALQDEVDELQAQLIAERDRLRQAHEEQQIRESQHASQHEQREQQLQDEVVQARRATAILEEQLSATQAELVALQEHYSGAALDRALLELTRMQHDYAQLERASEGKQLAMQDRIRALEERLAKESVADKMHDQQLAFQAERQTLTQAVEHLTAERDTLLARVDGYSKQAARDQKRLAEMEMVQRRQQQLYEAESLRLKQALVDAYALAASLRADAEACRDMQADLLRKAREAANSLNQRMQAVESGVMGLSTTYDVTNQEVCHHNEPSVSFQDLVHSGNIMEALALFEAHPSSEHISIDQLRSIGNAYRAMRRYKEAYAVFSRILERSPDRVFAEHKVIMTLFDLGRHEEAVERLRAQPKN